MVAYKEDALQITIPDNEPTARREWLIKAIAAAIRWRAYADDGVTNKDGDNLYTLAALLEQLTTE